MGKINGAVVLALIGVVFLAWPVVHRLEHAQEFSGVIPRPEQLQVRKGIFCLSPSVQIQTEAFCRSEGDLLAQRLRASTSYPISLVETAGCPTATIQLTSEGAKTNLGPEGYELEVTPETVIVRATGAAGIFYGTQSLLELLPPAVFSQRPVGRQAWTVPCVRIIDRPRFAWRGFMLDCSRHFFSATEIEQFLDAMALHKLNTFHWHLTDDQGWRIEIKKYPRLTQVGAWRKRIGFNLDPKSSTAYGPDGRYGGYYSQADIRAVVGYALRRHITIVPEIDLPGHSSAALAAYPQFSCSGGPYTTDMSEAVYPGVYCAGKEETFQFLRDVLSEVMDLFPGPFIHIGGDEVCKQNWRACPQCRSLLKRNGGRTMHDLETYFMRRIESFVNARGKRVVGWSEVGPEGLAPNAVLMDWIGGGLEAARAGHDVVMSPEADCYLDFYQSPDRSGEPTAAGAFLPLEKVYSFEPIPEGLEPACRGHILGAQGNLWTEYVPSLKQAEYMAFPRLSALAEVLWSPVKSRDWADFKRRLSAQERRLDEAGINYRHD